MNNDNKWTYPSFDDSIGKWAVQRGYYWSRLHAHGEVVGEVAVFATKEDAQEFARRETEFSGDRTRVVKIVPRGTGGRAFVPVEETDG